MAHAWSGAHHRQWQQGCSKICSDHQKPHEQRRVDWLEDYRYGFAIEPRSRCLLTSPLGIDGLFKLSTNEQDIVNATLVCIQAMKWPVQQYVSAKPAKLVLTLTNIASSTRSVKTLPLLASRYGS